MTNFADGNHALLLGEIAGVLEAVLPRQGMAPTQIELTLDDDRNCTNKLSIIRPSGVYTLTLTKEDAD